MTFPRSRGPELPESRLQFVTPFARGMVVGVNMKGMVVGMVVVVVVVVGVVVCVGMWGMKSGVEE